MVRPELARMLGRGAQAVPRMPSTSDQSWFASPRAKLPQRLLASLGLLALAALLSWTVYRGTGLETPAFYLAAAVLATWFGGLSAGAVIVVGGSVLSLHGRSPAPMAWETDATDWMRLLAFAVIAAAYIVLLDRVRSAGRALTRALQEQRTILELLPVGVAIVEQAARTAAPRINPALSQMLAGANGRDGAGHEGSAVRGQVGAPVASLELPLLGSASAATHQSARHLELQRPNGSMLFINARAAPLNDEDELQGAVAVYVDETESREREVHLEQANHAKDEFLGMVSHELKTPLTIISGNAEILARRVGGDDEMIRDALHDMRDASARLLSNVENLLTLARIGERSLELEPFPLCFAIERVVASHREARERIHVECPRHAFALGVRDVVEQVLENLLANALKYSPPDYPIEIDVSPTAGEFEIAVRDRGAGIPTAQLEAVFAAFYRSPDTSDMATGMGVGLAVCKVLVDALGGRMWAAARDGGGTEFVFTLPEAIGEPDETQDT